MIDILSAEDTKKFCDTHGFGRGVILTSTLQKIDVGESVLFSKKGWFLSTGVQAYVGQTFRRQRSGKKFRCRDTKDGKVLIIRIK